MKQQRLSASITIGSVLDQTFGKNIGLIRRGFDRVGQSIRDVKSRQKELSRQRVELVKQGRSVAALDREYEALERSLEDLIAKQRRWERAMRDSARVGDSFGKMSAQIGKTSRRIGVAAAAGAAGVFALTASTADYGDQVAKTAGKLGTSIEGLQELRYAAERSGVSVGVFDSSLTAMQKRLGEAANGSGAAKKALEQLGLGAQDLIDMGPEQAMSAIADELARVEQPAERAALAAALFSRSGIGMVNMLGQGAGALEQLRRDARKTGYVLSEEAARDAEAFADAQLDAQLVIKGLKNTIGAELMPVVTRSMKQFSALAVGNRDRIAEFANTAATRLEAALPIIGEVVTGIGAVSGQIGRLITIGAQLAGGWQNLGLIIGSVFAAKTILSVASFATSVIRLGASLGSVVGVLPLVAKGIGAVTALLMANPIGAAVGVLAGGAYLIYRNWETMGPWFNDLWGSVRETFSGIGDFISRVWTSSQEAAAAAVQAAWAGLGRFFATCLQGIGAVVQSTWDTIIRPVTDKLGMTDTIVAAWEAVKTGIGAVVDWLGQKFDALMTGLQPVLDGLSWLQDKGAGAVQGIGAGISSLWNGGDSDGGDGDANPRAGVTPPRISGSFLGGDIGKGPRLVGEQGPEVIWPSKGGYVAHAGATKRMAQLTAKAGPLLDMLGDSLGSGLARIRASAQQAAAPGVDGGRSLAPAPAAPAQPAPAAASAPVAPVVIHAQINAQHLTAAQIADELQRRGRAAQAGALYDQAHGYGQYGGG